MCLKRSLRVVAVVACSCAAATGAIAPAAIADSIPRPPGAIDNRGYELVSMADKDMNPLLQATPLSVDGNRAVYVVGGAVPGSPTGSYGMQRATRTATGWASQEMLPSRAEMPGVTYLVSAASPDLDAVVATANDAIGKDNTSPDVSLALLNGSGGQSLLHTFTRYFGSSGIEVVPSSDLRHVYVNVSPDVDPTLPGYIPGTQLVYDFGDDSPTLVSAMPGSGLAPACGVDSGSAWDFARGGQSLQSEHWTSSDGSRVFFATRGDTCSDPLQLYMRDVDAATTTLISGPPIGGDPDNGVERFLQATPNGAQVFYRTATSYDQADDDVDADNSDVDVYRWTAATGQNICLTCSVPSAQVLDPTAVSEDGSHVYFASASRLADAPSAADTTTPNTYVWRLGHPLIRFVARTNGVTPLPNFNGYVTPNGRVLVFTSNVPSLDNLSGGSNGGFLQYYRYESGSGSVTCISCPSGGVATADVPLTLAGGAGSVMSHVRAASDDGSMVFFGTFDRIAPEDTNGGADIYEWHDGVVKLITSGTEERQPGEFPFVVSASADGRDVLFVDSARLTSEAQDDVMKLYDARIDGGFPPAPAPPATCHGECRDAILSPPSLLDPGDGSSDGNVTPGGAGTFSVKRPTVAQRTRLAERGHVTLSVRVSEAGTLEGVAESKFGRRLRVVAEGSKKATRSGTVGLTIRLSKAARARLAEAGRLRVVLTVSFSTALDGQRLVIPLKVIGKGVPSRAALRARVRATADGR